MSRRVMGLLLSLLSAVEGGRLRLGLSIEMP